MKVNVKKVKDATGLTQQEIAKEIGCCSQWLTNIQREGNISIKYLYKLSKISNISIDKLIKK